MNELEFKIIRLISETEIQCHINDIKENLASYDSESIVFAINNLKRNGRIIFSKKDTIELSDDYHIDFNEKLFVHQNGILIGYLGFSPYYGYEFAYDTNYLLRDEKPVIFSMPLEFKNTKQTYIFSDFEENIPEGLDKKILMEKCGEASDFYLLEHNDYNANDLIFSRDFEPHQEIKNLAPKIPYQEIKKEILGNNTFPNILDLDIQIDDKNLFVSHHSLTTRERAKEIRNMSLSGFQHKTAVVIENGIMRLPNGEKQENVYYFIKPYDKDKANPKSEPYLPHLAINEHLYMSFAKNELEFDVPYTAIFKRPLDAEFHFLIKYFDRKEGYKIHRKEFSTIMDIPSDKKYGTTSEKLFTATNEVLDESDRLRMLEYYFYSFIIKHEDMHTKNISVLTSKDTTILAPLYDISTTGIYKGFKQESALSINGKFSNIKFNDFIILAKKANINEDKFIEQANRILNIYIEKMPKYIEKLKDMNLPIYDNERLYSKTKQLYDVMKNHYEKRLNELKQNGWFEALGVKLIDEVKYGSKFTENDLNSSPYYQKKNVINEKIDENKIESVEPETPNYPKFKL